MDGADIVKYGVSGLLALSLLVEITPIKINPWRWILKQIGNALNADLRKEIGEVKSEVRQIQKDFGEHTKVDDARNADLHRSKILQFNNELLRNIPHTREDFIEILTVIDEYRAYCKLHEEYQNSRAVHAISNIERVYDERLQKRDFLQ